MRPTLRLLSTFSSSSSPKPLALLPVTITLFTRPNCSLCVTAKDVLSQAWDRRHFEFVDVDILDEALPSARRWRGEYEFNVPVIHIQPTLTVQPDSALLEGVRLKKFMHRFSVEDVVGEVEEMETGSLRN